MEINSTNVVRYLNTCSPAILNSVMRRVSKETLSKVLLAAAQANANAFDNGLTPLMSQHEAVTRMAAAADQEELDSL